VSPPPIRRGILDRDHRGLRLATKQPVDHQLRRPFPGSGEIVLGLFVRTRRRSLVEAQLGPGLPDAGPALDGAGVVRNRLGELLPPARVRRGRRR
jgi:hypothetical protein